MSETLSFPGLGLEFTLNPTAFTVFGWPIKWYGIIIAAAFLLGAMYVLRRAKTFGLNDDRVMDVILGGVILGIICARLYYVLFSWDTYKNDLGRIIRIREGGIAIYGAVIGAVIAAVILCKWRKVKLLPTLDLAAGALLLGQAIGRWGNFVNIEAFGSNTAMRWGMTSASIVGYLTQKRAELAAIGVTVDPQLPVHPTFFYESMWCLLGFLFLAFYTKRRRFDGELALIYIGWYGLGRFFIEGLRTDSLMMGTIRVSQVIALLCVLVSMVALVTVRSRIKRANDPDYMPLFVNTEEGRAVVSGEFYKQLKEKKETAADKPADPEAATESPAEDAGTEEEVAAEADKPEETAQEPADEEPAAHNMEEEDNEQAD